MEQPDIVVGSLVEIDTQHEDEGVATRACQFKSAYAPQEPMHVLVREEHHVILANKAGKVIHFGSTADARLHVHYVKLAEVTVSS